MIWRRVVRFASGLTLATFSWQASPQAPPNPSFRVSVNLVQVDAVVTDPKGHHVRDLEAADFQVFEDGKAQMITSFSFIEGQPNTPAVGLPISQTGNLRKEDVGNSIVLMFDDSGSLAEEDLVQVFPAVKKFINDQLA
jgi:VWFA-related protein